MKVKIAYVEDLKPLSITYSEQKVICPFCKSEVIPILKVLMTDHNVNGGVAFPISGIMPHSRYDRKTKSSDRKAAAFLLHTFVHIAVCGPNIRNHCSSQSDALVNLAILSFTILR